MVDIFLVLLLPAGGDELQGIKKGIIEMADLIIVNKADGELKKSAEITKNEYQNALNITNRSRTGKEIGIVTCSSLNYDGLEKVWEQILKFVNQRKENKDFFKERDSQKLRRMWSLINLKVQEYLKKDLVSKKVVENILENVKKNKMSIYTATKIISDYVKKK